MTPIIAGTIAMNDENTETEIEETLPAPPADDAKAENEVDAAAAPDGDAAKTEVAASDSKESTLPEHALKRINKLTARAKSAEEKLAALQAENEQLKQAQLAKDAEAIRGLPVIPEALEGDELSQLVAAQKDAQTASGDADFWFGIASQGGGTVDGRQVSAEQAQAWARAADRKAGRAAATIEEISARAKARLSDAMKARRTERAAAKPAAATEPKEPATTTPRKAPPPPAQGGGVRPEGAAGAVGRAPQTQEEAKRLINSSGWGDDD